MPRQPVLSSKDSISARQTAEDPSFRYMKISGLALDRVPEVHEQLPPENNPDLRYDMLLITTFIDCSPHFG